MMSTPPDRQGVSRTVCLLVVALPVFVFVNLLAAWLTYLEENGRGPLEPRRPTAFVASPEIVLPRPSPLRDWLRRSMASICLNSVAAAALVYALAAIQMERRRRRRLGFPGPLDERMIRWMPGSRKRVIGGGQPSNAACWIDRKHRFDLN